MHTDNSKNNNANTLLTNRCFWDDLDRQFRRTEKMINWMINGQFQHGISPMRFPKLTAERIEELYNVDFGDQYAKKNFTI